MYRYQAYNKGTDEKIVMLTKESCGIRSIGRILAISPATVLRRLVAIAANIQKPSVALAKTYEADELKTYVRKKKNKQWVIYAIDRETKQVVDFRVGKRNKRNLKSVIETLLLSEAKKIYTDGFEIYRQHIPSVIHRFKAFGTQHIERKNLTLRTHLKRLSRRTICFSKSTQILTAVLRIYFWGDSLLQYSGTQETMQPNFLYPDCETELLLPDALF